MTTYNTIDRFTGCRFGSDGSVWTIKSGSWQIRKQYQSQGNEYFRVFINGALYRVHRLICEAFHGPCPEGMECCHGDGNLMNNAADNLRWDTSTGNSRDADSHGTVARGEASGTSVLSTEDVLEMRRRRAAGETLASLADRFGVTAVNVFFVVRRITWKHV